MENNTDTNSAKNNQIKNITKNTSNILNAIETMRNANTGGDRLKGMGQIAATIAAML